MDFSTLQFDCTCGYNGEVPYGSAVLFMFISFVFAGTGIRHAHGVAEEDVERTANWWALAPPVHDIVFQLMW